jgi:WD40 repeat protein
VSSVAFSPDGRTLAVGDGAGNFGLWDVASRTRTADLSEDSAVYSIAFSPDGQTVAVSGNAGDVSLWDADNGTVIATLTGEYPVHGIAFGDRGQTLAAGDYRGNVLVLRQDLWTWSAASFSSLVCSEVRGNMTTAQFTANVPDQPYKKTCPSYP